MFPAGAALPDVDAARADREELKAVFEELASSQYDAREQEFAPELMRELPLRTTTTD